MIEIARPLEGHSAIRANAKKNNYEWSYVICTIAAFIFVPEIRRIADWRGAFDPLNTFAVVPLLMLCPILILVILRRRLIKNDRFHLFAIIWISAFGYALLIGTSRGAMVAGLYAGAQFVLPLVVGYWLLSRPESMDVCQERLARWLLIFGALAGAYGIFQYIVAPPWDTEWMQEIGATSFGEPVPFGIRVFGVLNSPGTYGLFLGSVILINLPFLKPNNLAHLSATFLVVAGLVLSFIRSGWIIVLVGILVYTILSPKRITPILTLTYVGAFALCGTVAFATIFPNQDIANKLVDRVNTLFDLQDDRSAADRAETGSATFSSAFQQPVGAGLGLTGGSSKLQSHASMLVGAPAGDIDNGFASRFFEMGAIGFTIWLAGCLFAISMTFQSYRRYLAIGDNRLIQLTTGCLVVEFAIFMLNLTGDNQQGLLAVIFFSAVALPLLPQQLPSRANVYASQVPSEL